MTDAERIEELERINVWLNADVARLTTVEQAKAVLDLLFSTLVTT